MSSNQGSENGEEGIKVAIRMRPLNTKETKASRIWRVLQKYNSITQTTNEGKPLPERITGRTFFTFDKTFGEKTTTREVYSDIAQGIVESVVNGLNGTIFAYGQTSSGKTHTMQGSGTIEAGSVGDNGAGVVHMAARDIFSQINNDPERVFLLRVSFIEIYNEEVRDLLVSGNGNDKVLQIREDPTRGVFVDATENIVTDFQSLLGTLFAGEKHRAFAATAMNERSSRSHTIFRVTVESRSRSQPNDGDSDDSGDEDDGFSSSNSVNSNGDDDGAVRISTLNLVDLAGSESVKHTGATGDRLIEGAKINQSLLTLSRVIAALGSPSRSHINFRDSKLTRILQPSLSGNANMAIICCATPSEMYLEETRSTLQFASRAKLVKTRAQINEVLDERSMIKRLQKELALAKRAANGEVDMGQIKELKSEAAKAEDVAKKAQEKYERLKANILNGGMFQGTLLSKSRKRISSKVNSGSPPTARGRFLSPTTDRRRRRQSDGIVPNHNMLGSPLLDLTNRNEALKTLTPGFKQNEREVDDKTYLARGGDFDPTGSFQLLLLREALTAKGNISRLFEKKLKEWQNKAEQSQSLLNGASKELGALKEEQASSLATNELLSSEKEALELQRLDIIDESARQLEEKEKSIAEALASMEKILGEKITMSEKMESLEARNQDSKGTIEDFQNSIFTKDELVKEKDTELEANQMALNSMQELSIKTVNDFQERTASLELRNQKLLEASNEKIRNLEELHMASNATIEDLQKTIAGKDEVVIEKQDKLEATQKALEEVDLSSKVTIEELQKTVVSKEGLISEKHQELEDLRKTSNAIVENLKNTIVAKDEGMRRLFSEVSEKGSSAKELHKKIHEYEITIQQLQHQAGERDIINTGLQESLELSKQQMKNITSAKDNTISGLERDIQTFEEGQASLSSKNTLLENKCLEYEACIESAAGEQADNSGIIDELTSEKVRMSFEVAKVHEQNETLTISNKNLNEQLHQLKTIIPQLKHDIANKECLAEDLFHKRELAEALAGQMSEAEDSVLDELEGLMEEFSKIKTELNNAREEIDHEKDSKAQSQNQLNEEIRKAEKQVSLLTETNMELNTKMQKLCVVISKLKDDLVNGENVAQDLEDNKELAEALASQMSESEDSALAEVEELVEQLSEMQTELSETKAELASVIESHGRILEDKSQVKALSDEFSEKNASFEKELQESRSSLCMIQESNSLIINDLNGKEECINMLKDERSSLKQHLELISSMFSKVRIILFGDNASSTGDGSILDYTEILSELKKSGFVEVKELVVQLNDLKHDIEKVLVGKQRIQEDCDILRESQLSSSADFVHQIETLTNSKRTLEEELLSKTSEIDSVSDELFARIDSLESEKKNSNSAMKEQLDLLEQMEKENEELSSEIEQARSQASNSTDEINKQLEALQDTISSGKENVVSKEVEVANFVDRIQSLEKTIEMKIEQIAELDMNYSIEVQKAKDANKDLQASKKELSKLRDSSSSPLSETDVASLKSQVIELQQLLSSANTREQEAHNVALAADEELQLKEKQSEEASQFAAKCDVAIKALQEKNRNLELRSPTVSNHADQEELLKDMELMLDEKDSLERQLEMAVNERDNIERTLTQRFRDERTQLVQEGEAMMIELREKLTSTTSERAKTQRDHQMTRQKLIALEEKINTDQSAAIDADEKVLQLSEQLSSAERSCAHHHSDLCTLQEEFDMFKEHVNASKKSFKQSYETKLVNAKDELSELRDSLHKEASRANSFQEQVQSYVDKLNRFKADTASKEKAFIADKDFDINKLKHNLAKSKVQSSQAEAEIFSLKQDIEQYRSQTKKLKQKLTADSTNAAETEKYRQVLTSQENTIREKDQNIFAYSEKISNYEENVDSLKKNLKEMKSQMKSKEERIKYLETKRMTKDMVAKIQQIKAENKNFKEQNKTLKVKLEQSSQVDKENHQPGNQDENAALQTHIGAIEKKLRKYVKHCDDLKKEKDATMEMIKSTLSESDIQGEDLSGHIVLLCERLNTLEEECESLSELQREALLLETRLKQIESERSSLEVSLTETKEKLEELSKDRSNLEDELSSSKLEAMKANKKKENLQQIIESVKTSANELEFEKNRQVSYLEKENLHLHEELKKEKKQSRALKNKQKTSKFDDDDETADLGSILSSHATDDKENNENMSGRKSFKSKSPMSSGTRLSSRPMAGLGSGEGEVDDENTTECQQS